MGDIISGAVILLLLIIAFLINKKSKRPNTEKLIRNLLGLGALVGLVLSLTNNGTARVLGLFLFSLQLTSIISLSLKTRTFGYILLCSTLFFQVPIIKMENVSYRSQTLFGINIAEFPNKYLDIEPGSYLNFFNIPHIRPNDEIFPFGINLLSLVLFAYFVQRLRTWKKEQLLTQASSYSG
jgi:cell division protein FtsW (lipid II flippase)